MSYLKFLQCSSCATSFPVDIIQTFCYACQAPLMARYDLSSAYRDLNRDQFRNRPRGMWRWQELLPVHDKQNMISLGEGDTPLLHLEQVGKELSLPRLYLKDESFNPTGTFKARGLSVAVSKAKELGIQKFIIPTAGNAGGALAAYAARARLEACIFMPKDSPLANIQESRIAGANIYFVDGLINDAANMAKVKADEEGWFDLSTFKEPYRCEGKKTMGYEIAETFQWHLPDVIIYPTGGGTGLVGMWKAFEELETLGWLESKNRPKLVAVQSEGCAPVIKAFLSGKDICETWHGANTIATGLRVPRSYADKIILHDLRESDGTAIAVSDDEIITSQKYLAAQEGIFAAPEGAATLAALMKLKASNWIDPEQTVVLFNTGTGLKYLSKSVGNGYE
jgi:threonine synthase